MKRFKIKKKQVIAVIWLVFLTAVVLILLNIKPIVVGYATYNRIKTTNHTIEEYGRELSQLNAELNECKLAKSNLTQQLDIARKDIKRLQIILATLNTTITNLNLEKQKEIAQLRSDYEEEIGVLNTKLDKCQAKLTEQENDYQDLAENTARSICCKQKVDNPEISSYKIKNNRIVCLEIGGEKLKCPFD
ncbi:hypothetical protein DRJ48_00970 [Candidatus Woesearchaeota archaeon]|nr:hypothetical protein [Candidatus Woesearchaeota archaeon]RLE43442.1 MAG: hypothetical protein DRJ48_00970 [Candidatus Woesearchaeota archaeon]